MFIYLLINLSAHFVSGIDKRNLLKVQTICDHPDFYLTFGSIYEFATN